MWSQITSGKHGCIFFNGINRFVDNIIVMISSHLTKKSQVLFKANNQNVSGCRYKNNGCPRVMQYPNMTIRMWLLLLPDKYIAKGVLHYVLARGRVETWQCVTHVDWQFELLIHASIRLQRWYSPGTPAHICTIGTTAWVFERHPLGEREGIRMEPAARGIVHWQF